MVLQNPVNPGYAGTSNDMVGPMDYDPKIDVKYKSIQKATFSRVIIYIVMFLIILYRLLQGPERDALDKITAKMVETPGPGQYNSPSPFDFPSDQDIGTGLNGYKHNKSSVFLSSTNRDSVFQDIKKRESEPGHLSLLFHQLPHYSFYHNE